MKKPSKVSENIVEQIKNNPVENYSEGLNREHLKEAVDYVFRQQPREKAQKGEGSYININQNKETGLQAISIKGDMDLSTGMRGFLNMLDVEDAWVYKTLPIKFNGVILDDEQTKQFWQQAEKMKENDKR